MKNNSNGKRKPNLGVSGPAFGADRPTVGLDDLLDDRKPDSRASAFPGPRFLSPVEPLEDVRKVFRWYSLPAVGKTNAGAAPLDKGLDPGLAPFWRILQGVLDEVLKDLNQLISIDQNGYRTGVDTQSDRFLIEPRLVLFDLITDEHLEIERLFPRNARVGVDLGEAVEGFDEPHKPQDLLMKGVDGLRCEGKQPVLKRLQLSQQGIQWRSKLVGHVRHELFSHRLNPLQVLDHLVKRAPQLADLVVRGYPDPFRIASNRELAGHANHLGEGAHDLSGHEEAQEADDQEPQNHRQEKKLMHGVKKHLVEDLGVDLEFLHEAHEIVRGKMIDHLPDEKNHQPDPQQVDGDKFPDEADFRPVHAIPRRTGTLGPERS